MSPRYRWIKLYNISFAVAMSVAIAFMIVMRMHDPVKDRHPINILGSILLLIGLYVGCFILVGIGFATRQYAVQSELEEFEQQKAKTRTAKIPHDYPGVTVIPDYSPTTDGPGRYRIEGVNRATKEDVVREIQANSAANAKAKAELDDILVTAVTKIA
ncbi:MAG: hypothetical protein ABSC42_02620 [Tepidisphaeraceae bacterium]|jgi:hypothetical protein